MENSSELYYERLATTTNPGLVLSQFYCSLFNIQASKSTVIMFNRLLNIYGRFTIYFSLLDMAGMPTVNHDSVYGLISYFCKSRLEKKFAITLNTPDSLDKSVKAIDKQIEAMKKLKLDLKGLGDE